MRRASRGDVVALPVSLSRETLKTIQGRQRETAFRTRCARSRVTENECEKEEMPVIRTADTKIIARELRARYDHLRAVTLIGRTLQKALFAGRSDEVVFWALVHAHYRGGDLSAAIEEQLNFFAPFIIREPSEVN